MSAAQIPASVALTRVPALDNTYGALMIGTFLGLILYGLTLHQAYRYFCLYRNDSKWLKTLVVMVLAVETFTSMLCMHACYYQLVTNYFHPQELIHPSWSFNLLPSQSGLAMVISQSFFVRRVWIIGARFRLLVIVSILCTLASQGFLTVATIKGFLGADQDSNFEEEVTLGNETAIASALTLMGDLLLTSVLISVLHRSRTGFKRTDSMIDLMIMYSVRTGLLTGIAEILNTILVFVFPGQLVYAAIGIPATKLYANTLLAALNSRQYIASCGGSNVSNGISAFGSAPPPLSTAGGTGGEAYYTPQLRRAMRAATNDADAVIELSLGEGLAGARDVRAEKEVV